MAIRLITGLPGNAKTLHAISTIKAQSEKEGRPVYYHGLSELTLPWLKLDDPKKWMDVPPNSIILIDEAQEIFRNRSVGATPPPHVTALETHRHLGIDLVLITQHPSFIDPHIRKLTNLHQHLVRIYGMEMSTIHQWRETRDNPDKNRKDSEQSKWAFDKSLYGCYKSAEVHTMKRKLPKRLFFLLAMPFVLAALVYLTYWILTKKVTTPPPAGATIATSAPGVGAGAAASPGSSIGSPGGGQRPVFDPLQDAKTYVQMNTPRVVGLPQTAPKYDQLTQPTRVPVPSMCIQSATLCRCFTQQGTAMQVETSMCISFARNGFFQEFDPEKDRADSSRTAKSVEVLKNSPVAAAPSSGQVVMFATAEGQDTFARVK